MGGAGAGGGWCGVVGQAVGPAHVRLEPIGGQRERVHGQGGLESALDSFASLCSWCSVDASGITSALASFISNNSGEVTWVGAVASAFEAAGGDGIVSVSDAAMEASLTAQGVVGGRRPLDVASPRIAGDPQTSGYADDPVNTTTGNFVEREVDLGFTGGLASLGFARTYNSVLDGVGALGPGWASCADERLVLDEEGARWVRPSGRHVVFPRLGTGWERATGDALWLEHLKPADDGTSDAGRAGTGDAAGAGGDDGGPGDAAGPAGDEWLVVSDNAGGRWVFDASGRLAWTCTGAGSRVDYVWQAGRLVGLAHERGGRVTVVWDQEADRIAGLEASDGRQVSYRYDASGRLVGVEREGGRRSYEWDEGGRVRRVVDADGVVEVDNTYNQAGQVLTQRSPFGRVSHYTYLPGGVTQVADEDGGRANTWIYDRWGRLVGMVDADGARQSVIWDRWGNKVMVTARDKQRTINQYDQRSRLTMRVEPTGARTTYDYDQADRVVRVTVAPEPDAAPSVTTFAYQGADRNPTTITDPCGGLTHLEWDHGLLVRVVDPVGVSLDLTYDHRGDLIATTNADGATARLERDARGQITAATTPLGHRTQYRYDQAGNLTHRRDPDGALWRWEYTPGGRLCTLVDPAGGRTEVAYGDHGAEESTTDAVGRVISTVYDDLGLKAGATLPDGSSWQFGWDALSRLRSVTDPTGARAVLEYTANGDLARTVDPTGVVQDFESGPLGLPTLARDADSQVGATWDALGRMVGAVNADGTTSTLVRDACGRVVERVDEHGGCTRLERDAAGRVVRVTQPSGASFSYEYDHLGRWVATISTGGRRYEMRYDSDSRLVGETWPDGQEVSTTFDVCGRITRRVEPGRGTTWFTYDKCGRISSVRDAWYGLRRFTYDDAGQLVSVTNALGAVTRFEYDRMGHRVAMVDAAGGRRTCTYDSMGRVRAMTDQVGRTTRYTYDAAGRVTSRADATGILDWAYGSAGRLERVISRPAGGLEDQGGDAVGQDAGAETIASIVRDIAGRTWSATGPGGRTDTLTWDAMGHLVSRSRGDQTIRWTYDADGLRTSMTHPDGSVTRYVYDADEMLAAVEHPALGRLDLQRDWLGRVTRAVAPGVEATWTWGPHGVVAHKVVRDGFVRTTALEYDEQGRVTAQSVDGIRTAFAYDAAGQLTRAVTDEGITTTYTWDALGRLEAGDSDGIVTTYTYDAAGQLLTTTTTDTKNPITDAGNDPAHNAGATGRAGAGADGGGARRQVLTYDAAGRRVSQDDGTSRREFTWDPRGFLAAYTDTTDGGGAPGSTHTLDVDTLGELAGVDGQGVMWDTAWGELAQVGHVPVTAVAGVGTGTGGPGGGWLLPSAPVTTPPPPRGAPVRRAPAWAAWGSPAPGP